MGFTRAEPESFRDVEVPDQAAGMTDEDRDALRGRGIGITNVVARATARADELGVRALGTSRVFVVPNPSGLNAHETVESLAVAYGDAGRAAGVLGRA